VVPVSSQGSLLVEAGKEGPALERIGAGINQPLLALKEKGAMGQGT